MKALSTSVWQACMPVEPYRALSYLYESALYECIGLYDKLYMRYLYRARACCRQLFYRLKYLYAYYRLKAALLQA
jgi:hypothetical protein